MEQRKSIMFRILLIAFALVAGVHAETIQLAQDGKALVPVVALDEPLEPVAADLARMLQRITGAAFTVQTQSAQRCVLLSLNPATTSITEREDYSIHSEKYRLVIVGNSTQAVEHAVWDLLHRIGFRQFFPGKTWEIVPHQPSLSIDIDVSESPDYHSRRIWAGFGYLKEREADYEQWNRRNRATAGITLSTGHAYDGILKRHEAEFAKHPEYLALVEGRRRDVNIFVNFARFETQMGQIIIFK